MGLQSIPAYARVLSHPEILDRNVSAGIFGERSGGVRPGDFAITPTGVTRQFSVASGQAYVHGRENAQQGGYVAWSDASENLLLAAPAASPRIDTLLLRVYDEQYGTLPSGTSRAQWDIVQGVAAASPNVRPDTDFLSAGSQYVPGAWWRVADFRSNPGDTTIPLGQIYPSLTHARIGGRTYGNRFASTTGFGGRPTDGVKGEYFSELDTGYEYIHNGTKWLRQEHTKIKAGATGTLTNSTALVNDPELWFPLEASSTYQWKCQYFFTALATPKINVALVWPNLGTGGRADIQRHTNGSTGVPFLQYIANQTVSGLGSTGYPDGGSWGVMNLEGGIITGSNLTAGNFQIAISQFQADPSASFGLIGSTLSHRQIA